MNKLLSIVIPTRNREYYCIEAIKDILSYDHYNFELIIQDNSDSTKIKDFVSHLNDDRIIYNYTLGRINSVINMDIALSLSTAKYVIMIGDDDTILPNIFDVVKWMDDKSVLAFSPKKQHAFFWNMNETGTFIKYPQSSKIKYINPNVPLLKLLKNGIIDYQSYYLPRVYHGIVKRELLTSIKNKTSHYIGGLSPDIYLSVAIALLIDSYVVADFPISISGVCAKSTSFAAKNNTHIGRLEDAPHLYKRGNYEWNKTIPAIYSVHTIWAESALQAIEEISPAPQELLKKFNKTYFFTVFKYKNSNICKIETQKLVDFKANYFSFLRYFLNRGKSLFQSLCYRIFGLRKVYYNVNGWSGVKNIDNP